jgi:hypothetical protein
MKITCVTGLALAAAALFGQSVKEDTFQGRRAFVLENSVIRVSTLPGGGFIGEIRLKSPDPRKSVNPLRVPHYQTIDPFAYDQAKHGALYGTDIQRRLMSGYMGHFLCFPQYGPTSEAEFRQDLGQHGEALAVEWKRRNVENPAGTATLAYGADLPRNQFRVERTISLTAGETVGYVEESVENLTAFDRPVDWVQHITFGPPFLQPGKNYVDAPVVKVAMSTGPDVREGTWPETDENGKRIDLRLFPETPHSGRYRAWLLDRSRPRVWFTMYNPDYPVLIGYVFPTTGNEWIGDWQENQRAMQKPWEGKVTARGIDIGTTPFAAGLRRSVDRGPLFGVPCFRWIQARERVSQSYLFFLAEIPPGFRGVADVRTGDGHITLVERETGKQISIRSSR